MSASAYVLHPSTFIIRRRSIETIARRRRRRAAHNNADKSDMPAAIVGVARFAHPVPIELIPGDVSMEDRLRHQCVGPQCNVVAEVQRLTEPIRSVKGNLSTWKLKETDRMELGRRLRADGATELTGT
eukprot:4245085-Prymnesium_polylepis.1